ncbi:hypothetical protein UFOVP152_30 [uncultured Caudovirales phage]|uniref:Uncharacterized protein n=1 Tax=uncultured Caudovirales phage TaxID=2100421 RepID=A0A6J7W8C2_9CAUD|nr:hypothetical protein UFOVP152_30 [uncultured Caudovirales phage]
MNTDTFDPDTGEVIEERAADGGRRYPSVTTLTDLIAMLNDGAFNMDAADKLQSFSADLEELGVDTDKKVKGSISIKIEVDRERGGVYFFTPALTFKLPPEKVQRTIGWVTDDNRFTPNRPGQGNLFGTIREITVEPRTVRGA